MANRKHAEWLREGVQSWNRRRKKVIFNPDLSEICFNDFLPPDFRDSPKTSRYFEKIDLSNTDLAGSDLSDQNFSRAIFSGAKLVDANLRMSNFTQANFVNADLSNANASNSIFNSSFFENSKLDGTIFKDAILDGAIFINSTIEKKQLGEMENVTANFFDSRSSYLKHLEFRPEHSPTYESRSHPEIISDGILYTDRNTDHEKARTKKNRYDVFFATNRKPIIQRGLPVDFSGERSLELNYGVCEVIIPEGHRTGSLGSPLWKRLVNLQDDRLRLDQLISLSDELFWKLIRDTADRMKIKEHPTIFIHGYNSTFEKAVLRSAQIGFDLGIGQGVGLFSWPSKGRPFSYNADEASAEASKYFLSDFIENFVTNSPTEKVNIIAHSMGCRCLVGALEILSNGRISTLRNINQIIMAAADIDTKIMDHQAKVAAQKCKRFTSYASDLDTALKISGWLHGYPRVGTTPPTFVLNGIDTIIVNDKDLGDYSHGYIGTSRTILGDIFALLKHNTPPNERHAIDEVLDGELKYWKMRN